MDSKLGNWTTKPYLSCLLWGRKKIRSMQQKSLFEVTYKSKLTEISQKRRNAKVGLVAIHPGILISLQLLIYGILSSPWLVSPATKWNRVGFSGDQEFLSLLGSSDYLTGLNVEHASVPSCFHPLVLFSLLKSEWASFLLHGSAHQVHDDMYTSSLCTWLKCCHWPVSFYTHLSYYLHNNLIN